MNRKIPWAETNRPDYGRSDLRYTNDLRDEEWAVISPKMPTRNRIGRPRKVDLRSIVNAILNVAATGCQWRMLPKDFSPYTNGKGIFL